MLTLFIKEFKEREILPVVTRLTGVDAAGYRPIGSLVQMFQQAGQEIVAFRTAEFKGDLEVNPIYRNYIDPVDRDEALREALARTEASKKEYIQKRKEALDKRKKEQDDYIIMLADRLRRIRDGQEKPPEGVSSQEG